MRDIIRESDKEREFALRMAVIITVGAVLIVYAIIGCVESGMEHGLDGMGRPIKEKRSSK